DPGLHDHRLCDGIDRLSRRRRADRLIHRSQRANDRMNPDPQKLVIVGHGAAGLAAAVSAAEQARGSGLRIEITLLEKAREAEAGGNTRWSPSYMRMAAIDRLAPGFEEDM